MRLKLGTTYRAKEVSLSLKILEELRSGEVSVLYIRNGFAQNAKYDPAKLEPYLLDENLYTTDELDLFNNG